MAKRAGFTLIELLVVLAIILVLITLLMPNLTTMRHRAESVPCKSNLRTLYSAMTGYAGDNNGYFPFWYATTPVNISWIQQLGRDGFLQVPGGTNYFESPGVYCPSAKRSARDILYPKLSFGMVLRGSAPAGGGNKPLTPWPISAIPGEYIMLIDSCRNGGPGSAGTLGIYVKGDLDVQAAVAFRHAGGKANALLFDGSVQSYTYAQMLQPKDLYRYSVQ